MNGKSKSYFSTSHSKNDVALILLILIAVALSTLVMFISRTVGDTVIVTVDNQKIGEYSLTQDKSIKIQTANGYNDLTIKDGTAFISSASCPDGICSSHRPIKHNGESIICLPNKVIVEINSENVQQPDIIS